MAWEPGQLAANGSDKGAEKAGEKADTKGDGKDALAKLSGPVDMIVTDLNMPNMDGIEFIRNVRASAQYKFVPIVMLTTESQASKKDEGKAAGATGWIVKPFKPDQLLAVAKKLLR